MRTETGTVIRLEDYRPSDYLIDTTDLTFTLEPEGTVVRAKLGIRRREGVAADTPLSLDGDELTLAGVKVNGEALAENGYTAAPDKLVIGELPADDTFTVEIETTLDPAANKQLMGLYRSNGTYCTQCEAEGFRRITYFLDRPDVLSVYTVRIEARTEDAPLLLSNGNRTEAGRLENGWHYAVWHDPFPKPSYLFALVAGNLGVVRDSFTTMSGRAVALEIYVEHGKEPRAAYAMDALKRSMKWDEDAFGREYDLDVFMIVAVSDFNMGAMENKGLNVFNDKYVLADERTATDADYANIEAIIAHEYFHNWTGNRITCRDWFQLCLKEGLTVFRDHEFSADMRSRTVKRIAEVKLLKAHQFPEDAGPLAHPVRPRRYSEINNFYTATVYEKGSEVVRMIRTILGPEKFRAGLDLYFDRHDGEAATIEQFLKAFEDASGTDLTQFALWYEQPGTPNLTVASKYDQASQRFTLTIEQRLKPPIEGAPHQSMHIPVKFGLVGASGDMGWTAAKGAEITDDVIHLRQPKHEIVFEGVAERPVASLLRGFSAPVTVYPEPDDADLAFLARNDSDEYGRWQALSALVARQMKQAAAKQADARCRRLRRRDLRDLRRHRRRRGLRTRLPRAVPDAAERKRHRARNRQRHRSGRDPCRLHGGVAAAWPCCRRHLRATVPRTGAGRRLFAGCGKRRQAVAAQHRARLSVPCRPLQRSCRQGVRGCRQHDRPGACADADGTSPAARRRDARCAQGVPGRVPERADRHGQVVHDPGDGAGRQDARHGHGADQPAGLFLGQSEPDPFADRRVLGRQSDRLQSGRRRRLPVPVPGDRAHRRPQSAGRGAPSDRNAVMEEPRARAARTGAHGDDGAGLEAAFVARRARHTRPDAGVARRPVPGGRHSNFYRFFPCVIHDVPRRSRGCESETKNLLLRWGGQPESLLIHYG